MSSKLCDKHILSIVQPYDNRPTFLWLNWSFIVFYGGFIYFWKKYFKNGKLMHGKMAQFFAFLRKSVFAHMISPATDFLGFFIFAFSMQNINFPYILFPLKKCYFWGMSSGTLLLCFKINENVFLAYNTTWKDVWTQDDDIS